jgi:4-amino-4-deoxy-L-arabinose transferase-like glycosyltransferase
MTDFNRLNFRFGNSWHREGTLSLTLLSMVPFVFLLWSSTVVPYGYFIDELYFIACSGRPDWGYIDQPPLSILLLTIVRGLFGNSMLAIRFLPALSIAATAFVAGLIARRLGGNQASMLLAALGVMVMPVFMVFGSYYSMNAFEPLIVTLVFYYIIRMIGEENPRYWLHLGILTGLGLEMKHTMILYVVALLAGFLLSPQRRLLWSRWLAWGGAAALILVLPNLVWQYLNGFPSLELYHNSFFNKNIEQPVTGVLAGQVIFTNPFAFPLWFTGLLVLAFPIGKPYRLVLIAYLLLLAVMIAGHSSRPDRIASVYPFLMASGAAAIALLKPVLRSVVVTILAILLVTGGIILAPVFCPILPPQTLKPWISRLGLQLDLEEGKKGEPVPQWLADRIGWRELALETGKVFQALPDAEKRNTVIISTNYGEAGALELYGAEFGLPPVYCTHNSFHAWGPPPDSVRTYIGVYIDAEDVKPRFDSLQEAVAVYCPDCTRPQRRIPIYVLRGPRFTISKEWEGFKSYN